MLDKEALDVDALAQEIRRVDGENNLGAGALAEALMPFLLSALRPAPAPAVGEVTEAMVERALYGRVPGGSEVWVWIAQTDAFIPSEAARDVVRAALVAALKAQGEKDG